MVLKEPLTSNKFSKRTIRSAEQKKTIESSQHLNLNGQKIYGLHEHGNNGVTPISVNVFRLDTIVYLETAIFHVSAYIKIFVYILFPFALPYADRIKFYKPTTASGLLPAYLHRTRGSTVIQQRLLLFFRINIADKSRREPFGNLSYGGRLTGIGRVKLDERLHRS